MHSFPGVTAHFINNFNLESVMLACCHFHGSHTGENILHQYEAITTSFNIHHKVRSVIIDNAADMLKAITLLDLPPDNDEKDDEDIEEDEFQPVQVPEISYKTLKTKHHRYFAYNVQLIVDGLKQAEHISRVLGKISKLVSHVQHLTIACDLLERSPSTSCKCHMLKFTTHYDKLLSACFTLSHG